MKLIPFRDINEADRFFAGARFIQRGTKSLLNVKPEEDFYEYILIHDYSMPEYMICAHIDKYEAGLVISHVKMSETGGVTAKEFKWSNILPEDIDNWFYHNFENCRQSWLK